MHKLIRKALPATLPVMAGYLFLGVAYGVTMKESGFGPGWALACSGLVYAGSLQFAMIPVMLAGFAPVTMLLISLLVNARHLFYGLAMLRPYEQLRWPARGYCIFALTDETFSLVCAPCPADVKPADWYLAVSALDQSYWVLGSVMGAVLGQVIPFDLKGIDFAMTALFTVIVTEQTADAWKAWRAGRLSPGDFLFPGLLGLGVTLLSLLAVGQSSFLLLSLGLMLALFYGRYRQTSERPAPPPAQTP